MSASAPGPPSRPGDGHARELKQGADQADALKRDAAVGRASSAAAAPDAGAPDKQGQPSAQVAAPSSSGQAPQQAQRQGPSDLKRPSQAQPQKPANAIPPSAQQLDLAAFLRSIHADARVSGGASSSVSGVSSGSGSAGAAGGPTPSLPLSATRDLVGAQLASVRGAQRALLSARAGEVRAHARAAQAVPAQADELLRRVADTRAALGKKGQGGGEANEVALSLRVTRALAVHRAARARSARAHARLALADALQAPARAVEAAEADLAGGRLARAISASGPAAQDALRALLRAPAQGASASAEKAASPLADHSWLADPPPRGLRAARLLRERARAAQARAELLIERAWDAAVSIERDAHAGRLRLRVAQAAAVASGGHGPDAASSASTSAAAPEADAHATPLRELAQLLESSGGLEPRLAALLARLRARIHDALRAAHPQIVLGIALDTAAAPRAGAQLAAEGKAEGAGKDEDGDEAAGADITLRDVAECTLDFSAGARDPLALARQLVDLLVFLCARGPLAVALSGAGPGSAPTSEHAAGGPTLAPRLAALRTQAARLVLPLVSQLLDAALPTRLSGTDMQGAIAEAQRVGAAARELHAALVGAGLADGAAAVAGGEHEDEDDDDDEDPAPHSPAALLAFAKRAKQRCFKRALDSSLARVRASLLALSDGGGGSGGAGSAAADSGSSASAGAGATVRVELRHAIPIPVLSKEPEPYDPFVDALEGTPSPATLTGAASGSAAESAQNPFDRHARAASGASSGTGASPGVRKGSADWSAGAGAGGGEAMAASGSHDSAASGGSFPSASAAAAAASPAKRPVKKGKAALGAARIVKPKDQLGSGPWDLDGSGLDDPELLKASAAASASASQPQHAAEAEDDAWDLDDQVAAPPPQPAAQHEDEDEDAAWFAEEEGPSAAAAPSTSAAQAHVTHPPAASMRSADTSLDTADIDDDAWGLSDEEIAAKRASRMGVPAGFDLQSLAALDKQENEHALAAVQEEPAASAPVAPNASAAAKSTSAAAQAAAPALHLTHDEDDDIDDDAWGLSSEEIAARRASRMPAGFDVSQVAAPVGVPAAEAKTEPAKPAPEQVVAKPEPTVPSASSEPVDQQQPAGTAQDNAAAAPGAAASVAPDSQHEDDIDDDAWGLSSEEIAARRASRLIGVPAGTDFSKLSTLQAEVGKASEQPSEQHDHEHVAGGKSAGQDGVKAAPEPVPDSVAQHEATAQEPQDDPAGSGEDGWGLSPEDALKPVEAAPVPNQLSLDAAKTGEAIIESSESAAVPVSSSADEPPQDGARDQAVTQREEDSPELPSDTIDEAPPHDGDLAKHAVEDAAEIDAPPPSDAQGAASHVPSGNGAPLAAEPTQAVEAEVAPPEPSGPEAAEPPAEAASPPAMEAPSISGHEEAATGTSAQQHEADAQEDGGWDVSPELSPVVAAASAPKMTPQEHEAQANDKSAVPPLEETTAQQPVAEKEDIGGWDVSPELGPVTAPPAMPQGSVLEGDKEPAREDSATSAASKEVPAPAPSSGDEDADAWSWDDDAEPAALAAAAGVGAMGAVAAAAAAASNSATDPPTQNGKSDVPAQPSVIAEMCSVSTRTVQLLQEVQQLLELADIAESHFGGDGWKDSPKDMLLHAALTQIDLHNAIMPAAHAEVLTSVPLLAMQFANDCSYIAQELQELHKKIHSDIRDKAEEQFRERAALTTLLGKQCFEVQMATQEAVLEQSLAEADGFSGTDNPSRYALAERAVKQVLHNLRSLASTWQPIMTRTAFLAAMGRLIDGVLVRLLELIEDLEDISAVESDKLAVLCKMFGPLEEIFVDETSQHTSVALFVPSWFKASYLSEILTGSLVDIEFLYFEAEALVDYSKAELMKLIRALFSDSANRSKLLHRIETA